MLIGSYLGVLGEKRRTAIPKKFLSELGDEPILAKWYENCLVLVSKKFWDELLTRITEDRKLRLGVRDIERFILGSAFEVEPDDQGRIIIPEVLVNYAKLDKELIFVGLADRLEIWNKNNWDEKVIGLEKETKEYIEGIGK